VAAMAKGKRKRKTNARKIGQDSDDEAVGSAVATAVDLDVAAVKAEIEAVKAAQAEAEAEEEQRQNEQKADDPYLMADAEYIQKDTRWRNKQRSLVFCSRGVTSRFRHLMEDIKKMLPHHKTEPKFDKSARLQEINEVCELKSCNNAVFFESRRKQDLYMWLGRVPSGPTIKFQVLNIHTTDEMRLAGNCLLGSRPVLHFDKHFGELSFLKLTKSLLIQAFGTPRNHPKSKPFHDHIMCFYYLDKKIWFRHYQIAPETPEKANDPECQILTEIGPRFVLDPIRILSGSFGGPTLYSNAFYMSPTALRIQAKKMMRSPYTRKLKMKADRKAREEANKQEEDPLDEAFI
jgi:ribosome biogenesis protein BRX1